MKTHHYELLINWTGNTGNGTRTLRSYSRNHELSAVGLDTIAASSDSAFRGDPDRWNPEQLFLASIAQCHMLWYLGLAAEAGIVVTAYEDRPVGSMIEQANGAGQFESVTLHPCLTITPDSDAALAKSLHDRVGEYCFIARSVKTPIDHDVTVQIHAPRAPQQT
ncbi:OsmC family protein [Alcaligenes sp. SMD-FA]|uniref:OsmC family protein n=1 Tax=Alcaligenes sp. SMD-FA TaxID=2991054 RepID=UPI002226F6F8|nr:OsmC family protein [Alcaligenes sp. SMD-FA]UYY85884.1 OsmC family protein [Alcaligenes sp. SMD-FA]